MSRRTANTALESVLVPATVTAMNVPIGAARASSSRGELQGSSVVYDGPSMSSGLQDFIASFARVVGIDPSLSPSQKAELFDNEKVLQHMRVVDTHILYEHATEY
jgi:hypothetical protein